jgi:hypothetical protein
MSGTEQVQGSDHGVLTADPPANDSSPPSPEVTPFPELSVPRVRPILPRVSQSSIRIRRVPSTPLIHQPSVRFQEPEPVREDEPDGRRRSTSEPQRPAWIGASNTGRGRLASTASHMPNLPEESLGPNRADKQAQPTLHAPPQGRLRRATVAAGSAVGLRRASNTPTDGGESHSNEYESNLVDLLDVVGL